MIGGTSTGGLIAIMLGRLQMDIDSCIRAYLQISDSIFRKERHRFSINGNVQGRFSAEVLEQEIRKIIAECKLDENALFKDPEVPPHCKVSVLQLLTPPRSLKFDIELTLSPSFVCATSYLTAQPVVLSSYYSPWRGSGLSNVATIWQAARATAPASSFFDRIEFGGEAFVDGATGQNGPINTLITYC